MAGMNASLQGCKALMFVYLHAQIASGATDGNSGECRVNAQDCGFLCHISASIYQVAPVTKVGVAVPRAESAAPVQRTRAGQYSDSSGLLAAGTW